MKLAQEAEEQRENATMRAEAHDMGGARPLVLLLLLSASGCSVLVLILFLIDSIAWPF